MKRKQILLKKVTAIVLVLMVAAFFISPPSQIGAKERTVNLPPETPVVVSTTESIESDRVSTGETVELRVEENVKVDDEVVIKAGTVVDGTIVRAEESSSMGAAGELTLQVERTKAVDGTSISLRGEERAMGEDKETRALALGLFLCLPALLISGEEAVIPAGKHIRTYVIGDYEIDIN